MCYAYEEAFAEKVRALGDRARPRDLYNVINLYRNAEARPRATVLLDVLQQKCEHRSLAVTTLGGLETHRGELEGSWQPMLSHQLQVLAPVESFWEALPEFFAWLQTGVTPAEPATYRLAAGESLLRERTLRLPVPGRVQSYLEIIRFAASNRLCVDLEYRGSVRRIEPFSLRRTRDDNIVLHATRASDGERRSYRIDRIQGARATRQSFIPRFAVELNPQGAPVIPPTASWAESSGLPRRRAHATPRRSRSGAPGRTVRDTSTSAHIAASASPERSRRPGSTLTRTSPVIPVRAGSEFSLTHDTEAISIPWNSDQL